jgi:hypothetical protein
MAFAVAAKQLFLEHGCRGLPEPTALAESELTCKYNRTGGFGFRTVLKSSEHMASANIIFSETLQILWPDGKSTDTGT